MMPKECKRLAEVDFPIAEVSRHAVREKSRRHAHPSTLHLWWARRPLASSRALLMALLLPDPCDPLCPAGFNRQARKILLAMQTRPSRWDQQVETDEGLRRVILQFIANFANWDNAANRDYVETGRALVLALLIWRRRPWSWTHSLAVAPSRSRRCGSAARPSPATSTRLPA